MKIKKKRVIVMSTSNEKAQPKLRIQHFPQVPCKPFKVHVDSVKEAHKIMNVLADYDLFQLAHHIKPDYANMSVLEMFDTENEEWCDWYDEETGIGDVEEYMEYIKENQDE